MMEHHRLDPAETPVEYLQRLAKSLDTGGCYTVEQIKVNVYPSLHKASVFLTFEATETYIETVRRASEESQPL